MTDLDRLEQKARILKLIAERRDVEQRTKLDKIRVICTIIATVGGVAGVLIAAARFAPF